MASVFLKSKTAEEVDRSFKVINILLSKIRQRQKCHSIYHMKVHDPAGCEAACGGAGVASCYSNGRHFGANLVLNDREDDVSRSTGGAGVGTEEGGALHAIITFPAVQYSSRTNEDKGTVVCG